MKNDVLSAIDEGIETFVEVAMAGGLPPGWHLALQVAITDSYRKGFDAGLSYREKKPNND